MQWLEFSSSLQVNFARPHVNDEGQVTTPDTQSNRPLPLYPHGAPSHETFLMQGERATNVHLRLREITSENLTIPRRLMSELTVTDDFSNVSGDRLCSRFLHTWYKANQSHKSCHTLHESL